MSIVSSLCRFLASFFSSMTLMSFPQNGQVTVNNSVVLDNVHAIYNNSPRNLEECNFPEFLERYGLTTRFDEVVIYRNDGTREIMSV